MTAPATHEPADPLEGLNDAQRRAVEFDRGPLAVLAGPGTGKTRVITRRVAHLIRSREVEPERIVAVTYTVKAANELRERLAELVGPIDAQRVNAHTFHGLGLGLIRRFADVAGVRPRAFAANGDGSGGIIDSAQHKRLLRSLLASHREPDGRSLFAPLRTEGLEAIVARVSRYFSRFGDLAAFPSDIDDYYGRADAALNSGVDVDGRPLDADALRAERERIANLRDAGIAFRLYREHCRRAGLLTFADLILTPIELLRGSARCAAIVRDEWRHFVVDEFQDVNASMIEFLRLLRPPGEGACDLCVVGDDDQAIYGFRGADERAFERFGAHWAGAERILLEENFRSREGIVRLANSIMSRASRRYAPDKVLTPGPESEKDAPPGPCIEAVHLAAESDDGATIAAMIRSAKDAHPERTWSSFGVITRTNSQAADAHLALRLAGIPATIRTLPDTTGEQGVQDVLGWARLVANPDDAWVAFRLLVRPGLSVPVETAAALRERFRIEQSHTRIRERTVKPGERGSAAEGFVAWLSRQADLPGGARRLLELHREFSDFDAEHGAAATIERIIRRTDSAHAELLDPASRAERLTSLLGLLRFARQRETRLEPPGNLGAFLAYFDDLDSGERIVGDEMQRDRIDGPGPGESAEERTDGVRVMTAHSAKGLEFDTVFVPRVSPPHGYPKSGVREEAVDLPRGALRDPASEGDEPDAQTLQACEERRVFYVACTRAMRRLVLLARQTKSRSKSVHYLQELLEDDSLAQFVSRRHGAEIIAADGGLGAQPVEAVRLDNEADAAADASPSPLESVIRSARRSAQALAQSAFAGAELDGTAERALSMTESARAAAARLAIVSHLDRFGRVPEWSAELGPEAGAFAESLRAQLAEAAPASDALPIGLPRLHPPLRLSYSTVSQYRACPRCFYVNQVLGLAPAPDARQIVGTAVHIALERYFRLVQQADAGEAQTPSADDLLRIGREAFLDCAPPNRPIDQSQLEQVLALLGALPGPLDASGSNIVEIERRVEFPFEGHLISTRLDRVDQITLSDGAAGFAIIDYKTGRATKGKRTPPADDLQLGIYALALAHAFEIDPAELRGRAEYWLLAESSRGVIDLHSLKLDKVRDAIREVIEGVLANRFPRGKGEIHLCDILGPGDEP